MMNPTANIESATATNAGFKQTEVGWIPVDWEVVHLGEIGNFKNGINKGKEDFGYGHPFVNLLDVFGKIEVDTSIDLGKVNSSDAERELYSLKEGDVIFVRSSVKPSGVGLTILCNEDLPNSVFSGFLIRYRDNGRIAKAFKRHCFHEAKFRHRLIAKSTVSANTNINQEALKALQIPLPPTLAEQTAIATALSDMDALIQAQEELLAKKRALKQGAMQELLTGKRRLVETASNTFKQTEVGRIPVDWEVRQLGEICSLAKNKVDPLSSDAEYKCVELENLSQETGRLLGYQSSIYLKSLKNKFEKGDVLFGKLRPYLKKYLFAEFEGVCSTEIWVIKSAYQICSKWLFYIIQSKWIEESANLSEGTKMPRANWVTVSSTPIPFPQTLQEQTAIATALSHMDTEIEQLEAQLAKYRQLKVGMMQELLTGKKRLV